MGGDAALRFFFDPVVQIRRAIAESGVSGEFGVGGWRQAVAVTHVVDVVDGDAAAFEKRRAEQNRVDRPELGGEDVGFGRKVAAQGRIAATGDDEVDAAVPGGDEQIGGDLGVEPAGVVGREAARIGQNEERGPRAFELGAQARHAPVGQDVDAVDRLDAGRIVVERDDLPPRGGDRPAHRLFQRRARERRFVPRPARHSVAPSRLPPDAPDAAGRVSAARRGM